MTKLFNHLMEELASKNGYSSLFKAFIAISTLFLVSTLQIINIATPLESDAYKLKFAVEKELNTELSFEQLECKLDTKTYESCKLAKYKINLSSSSLDALTAFSELLKVIAITLGGLSILGFIAHPFIARTTP